MNSFGLEMSIESVCLRQQVKVDEVSVKQLITGIIKRKMLFAAQPAEESTIGRSQMDFIYFGRVSVHIDIITWRTALGRE